MPRLYHNEQGIPHKFCPQCEIIYKLPVNHFSADSSTPDKLQYVCKYCKSGMFKSWLKSNYTERLDYNNQWQMEQRRINPEPLRAYHRAYEQREVYKKHRREYKA